MCAGLAVAPGGQPTGAADAPSPSPAPPPPPAPDAAPNPFKLRAVYTGEAFTKGFPSPDWMAVLTARGERYDLGGMSMRYFGHAWCGECPPQRQPLGMPADHPVQISPGPLYEDSGAPTRITTGTCPSGQACTDRGPMPAGTAAAPGRLSVSGHGRGRVQICAAIAASVSPARPWITTSAIPS